MVSIGEILIFLGALIILGVVLMEWFRRRLDAVGIAVGKKVIHSIFEDEEISASVVESVVKVISNHFASSKATSKRQQKAFDKKLVEGVMQSTNPMLAAVLDEVGVLDYMKEHPQLFFYAMSQYGHFLGGGVPKSGCGSSESKHTRSRRNIN